ncbi:hypothetical protein ACO0LM_22405 [Undibacterium sp. Di26W]|uniref:hypothetical protein n=1 Tax=Undibacterium sp. Di26W TaxID=3413035 RepID=UPI003BF3D606
MIVVGILTALGLEHAASNHQHHAAAELSKQQVIAEIKANLQEVMQQSKKIPDE